MNMLSGSNFSFPPLWAMLLGFLLPGLVGLAIGGICAFILWRRKVDSAVMSWTIGIIILMYLLFFPWMGLMEFCCYDLFDYFGLADNPLYAYIMYFCVWYLVIVGIAAIDWLKHKPRLEPEPQPEPEPEVEP